jgi:hypothetical protein
MATIGAKGKVRIRPISNGRPMFLAGFDGSTTWTEKGVMPKAEPDVTLKYHPVVITVSVLVVGRQNICH